MWPYGVMVSTLDFESKDPSSSLGRTSCSFVDFDLEIQVSKSEVPIFAISCLNSAKILSIWSVMQCRVSTHWVSFRIKYLSFKCEL